MNKIALMTMAMSFAMASCQEETIENLQPAQPEVMTLNIQLPETTDSRTYVLNYELHACETSGRSAQVWTGSEEIGLDGKVTLPVTPEEVAGGSLVVTEQGQSAYALDDLRNIKVDYNVGTQSYIGQLKWEDCLTVGDSETPIVLDPIKGKLQIVTDTDDFQAAISSGIDAATLQADAYILIDSSQIVVPNSRKAGEKVQVNDKTMVLLYENEFIVYEKGLQNVKFRLKDGDGYEYDFPLENLPMSPGNTTMVAGVSLTSDIHFNVTINPVFDGEYREDAD